MGSACIVDDIVGSARLSLETRAGSERVPPSGQALASAPPTALVEKWYLSYR